MTVFLKSSTFPSISATVSTASAEEISAALTLHTPTLKLGPSGVRAECSCGWGGMPRYTDAQAYTDHAHHVEGDQ